MRAKGSVAMLMGLASPELRQCPRLHDDGGDRHPGDESGEPVRDGRRLSATLPDTLEAATSETDFAMSTATALRFSTGSSFSLCQGRR